MCDEAPLMFLFYSQSFVISVFLSDEMRRSFSHLTLINVYSSLLLITFFFSGRNRRLLCVLSINSVCLRPQSQMDGDGDRDAASGGASLRRRPQQHQHCDQRAHGVSSAVNEILMILFSSLNEGSERCASLKQEVRSGFSLKFVYFLTFLFL